jgi:lipopolysaccharide export system protein LptA
MTRRFPGPPPARLLVPCAAIVAALLTGGAAAERADRYKPTHVEADRMLYDDLKQVNVFTGSVVLTQGSIRLSGDRLVLQQDPEGYQYGTATGRLATFRQKRDGIEEWIEGWGEEIHYDGQTETVRMTGRAKVRRLEGPRVVDEIDGAIIVYDSRSEQYLVEGGAANAASAAGGRVKVVIQPRLGDATAVPRASGPGAAPTAPAPRLAQPR